MIDPEQIDAEPTKGRLVDHWLYRRVDLGADVPPGIVRYEPALEEMVPDVRQYVAGYLNRLQRRMSERWLLTALHPLNAVSTIQIPLPGRE